MKAKKIEIRGDSDISIDGNANTTLVLLPKGKCSLEMSIGKEARVECIIIGDQKTDFVMNSKLEESANLNVFGIWNSTGSAKIKNLLQGRKSEANETHILIQQSDNKFDLSTYLGQMQNNTKGQVLVKAVVKENASTNMTGMIHVAKTGGGAESFLAQHALLLSTTARANAKPEIEVENNDVATRHSASVAPIDSEKVFYMMARGIPEEESKKLIVHGFLESAVEKIHDLDLREEMRERINLA